ncbi:hypothetical protein LCGC14_0696660 [marine sediment metagenome]|uniref:Glycosyltransferase 2-like domain-containing protein n=1 Tax=marine sediment metagenome TaxID=412755 RepID=A0A0F9QNS4_9ZZZZ|nr:glycosyltransferase family 2 protein [Methylophaga sp.]
MENLILEHRIAQLPLTVALLTYNRAHGFLEEAVNAILNQTFTDFELVILDNGSTDDTPQVILAMDDPRIRYVRNPPRSAVEFNYASAYHIARGKRIIVTHDDDIMLPHMLETQMRFMDEHPEVILTWTNVSTIDQKGNAISPAMSPRQEDILFKPGEYILNFVHERLWPIPSSLMLDRRYNFSPMVRLHYFNSKSVKNNIRGKNVEGAEDVLFPARANVKRSIGFIAEPLLKYRLHPSQGTNGVDLSTPSIQLYRKLRSFIKRTSIAIDYSMLFDNFIARYQVQKKITLISAYPLQLSTKRYFVNEYQKASLRAQKNGDAFYSILPLHILVNVLADSDTPKLDVAAIPAPKDNQTTAIKCFYQWAERQAEGKTIFHNIKGRVAILGSALVASLLVLEAKAAGVEVVCCLESNIHRQGDMLLGVPIVATTWLADNVDLVDTVIFSSEKDQENYLSSIIQGIAQNKVTSLSWKAMTSLNGK